MPLRGEAKAPHTVWWHSTSWSFYYRAAASAASWPDSCSRTCLKEGFLQRSVLEDGCSRNRQLRNWVTALD